MNERVTAASKRTFAAMRFRNYRLYFISQIISFSGTWMAAIAQSWLVLELTGSGTALGAVVAMQFLPTMLLAPIGGVIADRFDKRRLITATQTAAGLLALLLGVLTVTDTIELWMLYVIAALFGSVTALDNPSRQTFVMEMVGPEDLSNAVTLNSVVVNGARVIGPAIAGVLIATVGIGECFLINAASFVAVIVALRMMSAADLHPTQRTTRGPGQLREGLRYAWSVPHLRTTLVMLVIIGTITYEFTVTLPLLSEFTYGSGSAGLAAMTALMGGGAVVGGLAVAAAGNPSPRRFVVIAAAFGIVTGTLAVLPSLWMALVLMPFLGACSIAVIAVSNSMLQLNSAPMFRGRVMALFSVALLGSTPIGGPLVGFIGEHASPQAAIGLGGAASIVAALFGWYAFSKSGHMSSARRIEIPAEPQLTQPVISASAGN